MNAHSYRQFFSKTPAKILLLVVFIISVNLLSGYVAVWLRFPSLWGTSNIFFEYAFPLNLTWGFAHIPSFVLISIPLFLLSSWNQTQIQRFRIICVGLFLLLLYGVMEKVPFALYPAVDLFVAFFFSLIIVPPNYKENPKLTITLCALLILVILSSLTIGFSKWQHRTPTIKEANIMGGIFTLKNIDAGNSYRTELTFTVELTKYIDQETVCDTASQMGELLFNSYPFDNDYKKIIHVIYNPIQDSASSYKLGEVAQYEDDGEIHIGCYLKYKK